MLYTSYFARLKNLPQNIIPVAICAKAPEWYKGLQYKRVAPRYGFFMEWKRTHDNAYYIEHYNKEVLSKLTPREVISDIYALLPLAAKIAVKNGGMHVALICYEKPNDFCHRHLLAEWLTNAGIKCEEWK